MTDKSLRARPGQAGVLLERMAVRHILSQRRTGRHTCSRAISLCHHFHWVSLPRTNKPLLHTQIYVYGHLSACSHRFSGAVFLFPSRFKFLWWKQNLMCIYYNYCSFFFFYTPRSTFLFTLWQKCAPSRPEQHLRRPGCLRCQVNGSVGSSTWERRTTQSPLWPAFTRRDEERHTEAGAPGRCDK